MHFPKIIPITRMTLALTGESLFLSCLCDHCHHLRSSVSVLQCLVLFTALFTCFIQQHCKTKTPKVRMLPKHICTHTHTHTHFNRVKNPTMYFPLIEYGLCTCMHNLQSTHKYEETYKHTLVSDPDKPLTARVKSLSLHDKVQEAGLLRLISLTRLQTALTDLIRIHSESF